MSEVDIEILISLVQEQPVLWDKTVEDYKDRIKTKNAWTEVFKQLNEGFEEMEDNKRNEYAKNVMKKWSNIRDSFQRSERNFKQSMKSGNARQPQKCYIYGDQLKFLKKTVLPHNTDDSFIDSGKCAQMQEVSGDSENENGQVSNSNSNRAEGFASGGSASFKKPEQQKSNKRKADPVELELLGIIKRNDRHTSFFAGIIPSLETFDDDEVVEFQLKVLQTVSDIKKRKKNANLASENTTCLRTPAKQNDIITVQGRQYQNLQPRQTPSTSSTDTNFNLTAAQYFHQVGSSSSTIELSEQFSENSSLDDFQF